MSQYEIEMTIEFPDAPRAGKFVKAFETEHGYPPDRIGSTVTCFLYSHGDEIVMREKAKELGGKVNMKVLSDTE